MARQMGRDPLLDVRDRDDSQEAYYMGLQERDTRPHRARQSDDVLPKAIAGTGCWCGKVYGHDWEGKSDGKPHPR